jgi:predicted transcriptional regulator of viral defense system
MNKRIVQFFYENPVFRWDMFCDFKAESGTSNQNSVKQLLQYYIRTKKIIPIRRELFAVLPPNQTAETFSLDPYVLAANLTGDSVLAYHTALALHGVAYSTFQRFTFLTSKKIKTFYYKEQVFQAINPSHYCQKSKNEYTISFNRGGSVIMITSLARTFVDVLDRPNLSGGWEEVARSLEGIAALNIDEVIAYCLKLRRPVLCAKVGFFLEQRQGVFAASEDQIAQLVQNRPKSAYNLRKQPQESSQLVKKWNLMVPKSLLYNQWEEPLYDI